MSCAGTGRRCRPTTHRFRCRRRTSWSSPCSNWKGAGGEAVDQEALARRALAWTAGLPEEAPLELEQEWIEPTRAEVPPRDSLFALAFVQAARLAPVAGGNRREAGGAGGERQRPYLPQLFLTGGVRYAVAPNRTDQHNPFVKDEFNYFNGGVFLGLRQSLEWGLLKAEAARARADLYQLRAKESGGGPGYPAGNRAGLRRLGARPRRTGIDPGKGAASRAAGCEPPATSTSSTRGRSRNWSAPSRPTPGRSRGTTRRCTNSTLSVARLERAVGMTSSFE